MHFSSPLLLSVPREATVPDLDERLSRVASDAARSASSYVFRIHETLLQDLRNRQAALERERLLRRAGGKAVYALSYSETAGVHLLFDIGKNDLVLAPAAADSIPKIRETELQYLLASASDACYFTSNEGHHYITPALVHTTHFVRVSDAIRSLEILDTFAFWLKPELRDAHAVLADTWGISNIILRTLQELKLDTPFDCLPGHPEQQRDADRLVIARIVRLLSSEAKVLVVCSLSQTGRALDLIQDMIVDVSRVPLNTRGISLFCFKNTPAHLVSMCRLPDTPESYASEEECPLCRNNIPAVKINPSLYYIKAVTEKPVPLRARHFEGGKPFLRKYGGVRGLLRVHRDDPNDGRHHAFDVDVKTLGGQKQFKAGFRRLIGSLKNNPDVIVTPNHEMGRVLAGWSRDVFRCPIVVHNNLRRVELNSEDNALVRKARHLLIIDDVINSGSRLETFNCSLREEFQVPFSSVTFVVGLARTESEAELQQIMRSLTLNHSWTASVRYVEKLCLPRLTAQECPWCREYDYLAKTSGFMASPPRWVTNRLSLLSNRTSGLCGEPLLLLPKQKRRRLGQSSVIGPRGSSSMTVVFAIASALQALRNDENALDRLHPDFPLGNVCGLKSVMNYSEGLVRSVLLRLLTGPEWGASFLPQIKDHLTNAASRPGQEGLCGEILLASSRGDLPKFGRNAFKKFCASHLGAAWEQFYESVA